MLKNKEHKTGPKSKLYVFMSFIVNKASYFLNLELHTCSDKTQLDTALHSRLEAMLAELGPKQSLLPVCSPIFKSGVLSPLHGQRRSIVVTLLPSPRRMKMD